MMPCEERDRLLDDYVARAREFSDAVERLRRCGHSQDVEAFIHALDEAGRLHRRCERSRIQVDKHLAEHGC